MVIDILYVFLHIQVDVLHPELGVLHTEIGTKIILKQSFELNIVGVFPYCGRCLGYVKQGFTGMICNFACLRPQWNHSLPSPYLISLFLNVKEPTHPKALIDN